MATIKEQIEIIQAYERGEEVEIKDNEGVWRTLASKEAFIKKMGYEYGFNFSEYEYRIKKKRWRAEKGEKYYFINSTFEVRGIIDSCCYSYDDDRFSVGNYFRTIEGAEKAIELLKECLTKFHEEND